MLYFAYGSNMSSRRLLARVPSARLVSTARLPGHDLRFHKRSPDGSGKCDAFETRDPKDRIHGVAFMISPEHGPILDHFEELDVGYRKKTVTLLTDEGEVDAFTYAAIDIAEGLKPYDWYRDHVLRGAIEHGLPAAYVDRIRRVAFTPDPDVGRGARESLIYREPQSTD